MAPKCRMEGGRGEALLGRTFLPPGKILHPPWLGDGPEWVCGVGLCMGV